MIDNPTSRYEYTLTTTSQVLPYANKFLANSHIQVARIEDVDGISTLVPLTEASDYSIVGAGDPDGGSVTMIPGGSGNVQVGDEIVLRRNMSIVQLTSFIENGTTFGAFTTEDAVDRLTMICQMLLEIITNTDVGVPPGFVLRRISYCRIDGVEVTSTFMVRDD